MVQLLLDRGAIITADKDSIVADAACHGSVELIHLLLDLGANASSVDDVSLGPSGRAHISRDKHAGFVRTTAPVWRGFAARLCSPPSRTMPGRRRKHGFDPVLPPLQTGLSALFHAISRGESAMRIVQLLCERGAQLVPADSDRLYDAVESEDVDLVRRLLDHGADPDSFPTVSSNVPKRGIPAPCQRCVGVEGCLELTIACRDS